MQEVAALFSSLLKTNGLINTVAGSNYNFRYQITGDNVLKDVSSVIKELEIQPKEIYTGQQMHTNNVAIVDKMNSESFVFGRTFKETDGLITNEPGVALLIKFADCTPILLFDPVEKVQASVHSGWRGTTQTISIIALELMEKTFGCKRENILAYVGPSIDQDHYEVGKEVYEAFKHVDKRDTFFEPFGDKFKLSMLDANIQILLGAGIKEENMEVERTSTFTASNLHSARAEGKNYGLNAILSVIR